jgi:hypothetical protein
MEEGKKKDYKLIVNAQEKSWEKDEISYHQVIKLAFGEVQDDPNTIYTVTYSGGPKANPEGSLVKGKKVEVKNRMIFNATPTTKS